VTINGGGSPSFASQNATLGEIGHTLQLDFQPFYRNNLLTANEETRSDAIVVFPSNGNGVIP
jgi:hypothetical protein